MQRARAHKAIADLRRRILTLEPGELGLDARDARVFGLVLDLAHPGVTQSLVVLADGTVNLFAIEGGGDIGAGRHPRVREAADRLLLLAEGCASRLPPDDRGALPGPGRVGLHLLTRDGVRATELDAPTGAPEGLGADDVGRLVAAGSALVAEIREVVTAAEAG